MQLATAPAAAPSGFHRTAVFLPTGVTLEYVEQGDRSGVPLVLLHGITDSWRSFEPLLPHLPASVHAFALSVRGHGGSDRPPLGYRVEDHARDVDAFMEAVGLSSAVILGHSMGSAVALRLALDAPSRVRRLVLMGADPSWRTNAEAEEFARAVATLSDPVSPAFARAFQESTIAMPVPDQLLETAIAESLRVPARVWKAATAGLRAFDASGVLRQITAPTLVIWGDRDAFARRRHQEVLTAGIAGARLVTYEGVGHAVHWEQPQRVAADVAAFALAAGSRQ